MTQRRAPSPEPETPRASPPLRAMDATTSAHIFDYRGYGGPAGTFTLTAFNSYKPSYFNSVFGGTFGTFSGNVSAPQASDMMQNVTVGGSLFDPTATATVTVGYGWDVGSVGDWPRVSGFSASFSTSYQTTVYPGSTLSIGTSLPQLMPLFVGPPAASPATKFGAVPARAGGATPTGTVYIRSPGTVSWSNAFGLVNLYYFSISGTNTVSMT